MVKMAGLQNCLCQSYAFSTFYIIQLIIQSFHRNIIWLLSASRCKAQFLVIGNSHSAFEEMDE